MVNSGDDNQQAVNNYTMKLLDTLTPAEQNLLEKYHTRKRKRHEAPTVKVKHTEDKPHEMSIAGDNQAIGMIALCDACGTTSLDFQARLVAELINVTCFGNKESDINGVIAAMHGIAPRDETEGMLAAQMVATHTAAMRCMRQLGSSDTILQQNSNGNLAIKLLRTYTTQIEALNRYRGKGQQKMTVEHIHVHSGGQAIVGNVSHPEGGG